MISKMSHPTLVKTILMKIDDSKEYPLLNWTKYLDWSGGVTEYQVQVYDVVSNDFKKMAVLTADTFYTDLEVRQNDSQNCYRIAAYRADGIFSLSNVRCLPTPFYLWTPNAFTPNQDLLNDTFSVAGKKHIKIPDIHLRPLGRRNVQFQRPE